MFAMILELHTCNQVTSSLLRQTSPDLSWLLLVLSNQDLKGEYSSYFCFEHILKSHLSTCQNMYVSYHAEYMTIIGIWSFFSLWNNMDKSGMHTFSITKPYKEWGLWIMVCWSLLIKQNRKSTSLCGYI